MKRSVADSCREYVESLETDGCEVTAYLCDDAKRWMATHGFKNKLEVHHITGRPGPEQRNNFCNLIRVSDAAHDWGHDVSPVKFELACFYAKWKKHLANLEKEDTGMRNRLSEEQRAAIDDWHLPSLDRCMTKASSYEGRLSVITNKLRGTHYAKFGRQILRWTKETQ